MSRAAVRLFILLVAGLLASGAGAQPVGQIAAVVNDTAISVADLEDRIRLALVTSDIPDTAEARNRVAPQALRSLIDEQLRVQEARRLGLDVTTAEVKNALDQIARDNNVAPSDLPALLRQLGVPQQTLVNQIVAEIAWSKVVIRRLRPQVQISDEEIDEALARIEANVGKSEARVSEIFLSVDSPSDEPRVREAAERLVQQLRSGADFANVARQFSDSASAATGGDIGWVLQGQLAPELDAALSGLAAGQVSDPVRTFDGYHILMVRDRRTVGAGATPDREQIANALGNAKLDLLQRRYLRDLRREAFIDVRI